MPAVQFSCIGGLMSNPAIQFFEEYYTLIWTDMFHSKVKHEESRYRI